jgi:hypothetical protein
MKQIKRVTVGAMLLVAIACFVGCAGHPGSPPPSTSFTGNFRVNSRVSVNYATSYAEGDHLMEGDFIHFNSGPTGGTVEHFLDYTGSDAFLTITNGKYNAAWFLAIDGYPDCQDGNFQVNVAYKATIPVVCQKIVDGFFSYSSSTFGYIATQVPDEWGDQSPIVPTSGDPGTMMYVADRDSEVSTLWPDDYIDSEDGSVRLLYQADGNLVLYDTTTDPWTPFWATGTVGQSTGFVSMQSDGNLVLYDGDSIPLWATGTDGNEGAYLVVCNNGDLLVLRSDGFALWWSASGYGGTAAAAHAERAKALRLARAAHQSVLPPKPWLQLTRRLGLGRPW